MNLPLWVAIPVVALLIPITAIIMDGWQKMKEREHTHRERIKAMEMGMTQALPTLAASTAVEPFRKPRGAGYHGAVWAGLGAGLLLSTLLVRSTSHSEDMVKFADFLILWSFPALCIGLGLLLYAGLSRRNRTGAAE
jgi:cytochrome c-type biogenesis protein CcmH/NrfF